MSDSEFLLLRITPQDTADVGEWYKVTGVDILDTVLGGRPTFEPLTTPSAALPLSRSAGPQINERIMLSVYQRTPAETQAAVSDWRFHPEPCAPQS